MKEKDLRDFAGKFKVFIESVFEGANVEVYSFSENIECKVQSEHELGMNFGKLLKIGELLGTLDFDIIPGHEVVHCEYSEYTAWDEHTYSLTFRIPIENLGSGLPWKKEE